MSRPFGNPTKAKKQKTSRGKTARNASRGKFEGCFFGKKTKNGAEEEEVLHGPMFTTPKRLNLCA